MLGRPGGGKRKGASKRVGNVFLETHIALRDIYRDAAAMEELDEARVVIGWELVRTIGHNINSVSLQRKKLTSLDEHALAQFDADLAGLKARYARLYKPIFTTLIEKHPIDWSDEEWDEYEHYIEGPIVEWNINECREADPWPEGLARCVGPDLLTAFSLMNQVFAASEVQIQMGTTILGRVGAALEEVGKDLKGAAKTALDGLIAGVEVAVEAVEDAATAAAKGVGGMLGRHLWIPAVVIIGGVLYLRRGKRK